MIRSQHDLSHTHLLSGDMGQLLPVACVDMLPGDSFLGSTSVLARVAPLAFPVMHPVQVRLHHFFVPNRLLWDQWEDFITSSDPAAIVPQVSIAANSVLDHMGVEPVVGKSVDALALAAYNMIWNEYYRDQDLQQFRQLDDQTIARVGWQKDYFTSSRAEQSSVGQVEVGFSAGQAPVMGVGFTAAYSAWQASGASVRQADGSTVTTTSGAGSAQRWSGAGSADGNPMIKDSASRPGYPDVYADLTQMVGGISINDLRTALALERMGEARAAYGERYTDVLQYLGLNPQDSRFQKPEYIGGSTEMLSISEVLQTSEGTAGTVGDMYGHGIAATRSKRYRFFAPEHGWFFTLLAVRPATMYQNGIPRRFRRAEPTDYWNPEFEVLPWQTVDTSEVYGNTPVYPTPFGYAPKFAEYRHFENFVSGSFRNGTEQDWHYGRSFSAPPALNSDFITCTPTDRVYSDTSMPEILVQARNRISARRLVRRSASFGGLS